MDLSSRERKERTTFDLNRPSWPYDLKTTKADFSRKYLEVIMRVIGDENYAKTHQTRALVENFSLTNILWKNFTSLESDLEGLDLPTCRQRQT